MKEKGNRTVSDLDLCVYVWKRGHDLTYTQTKPRSTDLIQKNVHVGDD